MIVHLLIWKSTVHLCCQQLFTRFFVSSCNACMCDALQGFTGCMWVDASEELFTKNEQLTFEWAVHESHGLPTTDGFADIKVRSWTEKENLLWSDRQYCSRQLSVPIAVTCATRLSPVKRRLLYINERTPVWSHTYARFVIVDSLVRVIWLAICDRIAALRITNVRSVKNDTPVAIHWRWSVDRRFAKNSGGKIIISFCLTTPAGTHEVPWDEGAANYNRDFDAGKYGPRRWCTDNN